jgi:TolB-like protein
MPALNNSNQKIALKSKMARRTALKALALALPFLAACSHSAPKTTPELSQMLGKKVAFVEIVGEKTAQQATEVALINQLTRNGTFIIVSKEDVEAARIQFQQDPSDWKGIAKRAGADYALKARVLDFTSQVNVGYSHQTVDDSQMEAETGEAKSDELYKVKRLVGHVKVELQFANLADGTVKVGTAEKDGQVEGDERKAAVHLPPRLSFLISLLEQTFQDFFKEYQ